MEIAVDAYGPDYLQDTIQFPFTASCISKRRISSLKEGQTVEVVGMAPEDERDCEMFVEIHWEGDTLAVPLIQLEVSEVDKET